METIGQIKFPEEILLSLREDKEGFIKEMKRISAVNFYIQKKLSIGQCSELAEMGEEEFIKYLSLQGVSIFQYKNVSELQQDLKNA